MTPSVKELHRKITQQRSRVSIFLSRLKNRSNVLAPMLSLSLSNIQIRFNRLRTTVTAATSIIKEEVGINIDSEPGDKKRQYINI